MWPDLKPYLLTLYGNLKYEGPSSKIIHQKEEILRLLRLLDQENPDMEEIDKRTEVLMKEQFDYFLSESAKIYAKYHFSN